MISAFAAKLRLMSRPTIVNIQKLDGTTLDTYGMISAIILI